MGRLTRKQRASRAWVEFLKNSDSKNLDKLYNAFVVYRRLYGNVPLIVLIRLFQSVKEAYCQNTNVAYRNALIERVYLMFGSGFAAELQRISNTRTW